MNSVKMDKYYSSLLLKTNIDMVVKSGYIPEKYEINHEDTILELGDGVILLTTGSFAPMHQGHVSMMQNAYEYYKNKNIKIAASFFSFSHDNYVLNKDINMPSLKEREKKAQEILQDSGYFISLWEAEQLEPINFTTVIDHFQQMYPNNEIIYVFGKDNYNFANAFVEYGKCLYVPAGKVDRSNYEFIYNIKNAQVLEPSKYSDLNSRDIRRQSYCIRDDSQKFNQDLTNFKIGLKGCLSEIFPFKIIWLDLTKQLEWIKKCTLPTISLDMYFKGTHNINCSRLFQIKSQQEKGLQLTARIGHESLQQQCKSIPAGKYILVDDDIASGETVKRIKSYLPENVQVTDTVALTNYIEGLNIYDIVDLRDFVIGFPFGGLQVISEFGQQFRVPYISPWVNLQTRAKIPDFRVNQFSLKILQLNYQIYKDSGLKLKDLEEHKEWLVYLGFNEDDLVDNIILKIMKDGLYDN